MKNFLYILCIAIALIGCETTIAPDLDKAEKIMVVDAWINQKMERQEIMITRSQSYFDNSSPILISGAAVTVEDLNTGMQYNFQESATSYYWDPVDAPFGVVGHRYRLTVTADGETFEAYSRLGRVPPIDSIKFNYNARDLLVKQDYYTAEFVATDPAGIGDTYWIKAWKNNTFLAKPGELNMTYDAGFTPGQSVDGQVFIIPIRKDFINPLDEIPEKQNEFFPPYQVGDSVHVEIHSIDPLAYDFLFGLYYQINRPGGFAELFSMPLANSPTNLKSTDKNSVTNVAGFFNVASVSAGGKKLTQEMADKAKKNRK
jgi:hypothetical protein